MKKKKEKYMVQQIIDQLIKQRDDVDEVLIAIVTKNGENFLSTACTENLINNMLSFLKSQQEESNINKNKKFNS